MGGWCAMVAHTRRWSAAGGQHLLHQLQLQPSDLQQWLGGAPVWIGHVQCPQPHAKHPAYLSGEESCVHDMYPCFYMKLTNLLKILTHYLWEYWTITYFWYFSESKINMIPIIIYIVYRVHVCENYHILLILRPPPPQHVLHPYDPNSKHLRVDKNICLRVYCKDKAPGKYIKLLLRYFPSLLLCNYTCRLSLCVVDCTVDCLSLC